MFVARLGVEPTRGTRFYFPCPLCRLPIRGSMSGSKLSNHQIVIDCEMLSGHESELDGVPVVTVNPFVPSLYDADSYAPTGAFPTMTLVQILGDDTFLEFKSARDQALDDGRAMWPPVGMLFRYYLQGNAEMFTRIAKKLFELEQKPSTSHQRTSIAYQALAIATTLIMGSTGTRGRQAFSLFGKKHTAAMNRTMEHLRVLRERGQASADLERDLFTELDRFVQQHESWEMGLLGRFVDAEKKAAFEELVLFRDEFSTVRDLYQQGFELACKCLWLLVAAQNTVERGSPDDFGDVHPEITIVPVNKRPTTLKKFDGLSNAQKIAYVAQVPGWESFAVLLNNRRRNAIGHATAHHELQTGRVVSDKDPTGMTYLEFLGETFGVFEALSTLAQALRTSRVAASPDFGLPE